MAVGCYVTSEIKISPHICNVLYGLQSIFIHKIPGNICNDPMRPAQSSHPFAR